MMEGIVILISLIGLSRPYAGNNDDHDIQSVPFKSVVLNPFLFAYPQIQFLFNFVPSNFLVYNSSYTRSVIYIQNKLNKSHPK
jgi:hypothetical protein